MRAIAIICVIAAAGMAQPPSVTTLDGRAVDPFGPEDGIRAIAFIFTRTDCPIANQTAPEIERVRTLYGDRGVRFWLVYVDPIEPADRVHAHMEAYGLAGPAIRDPDHVLVRQAGVHVTPEAAVYLFDRGVPRLVYRGRLDDRAVRLGRQRPSATQHDLEDALEATLAGRLAEPRVTPAVGCAIGRLK